MNITETFENKTSEFLKTLEDFFEEKDGLFALKDMYRVTAAHQAIYDEVYVMPVHRLAELESKPVSSLCYRTCSEKSPVREMLSAIWATIVKHPDAANAKLQELKLQARLYGYRKERVRITALHSASFGSSFEDITLYRDETLFHYPPCLYEDHITPLPQGMHDLQRVTDIFYAICSQKTIDIITKELT